MLVSESFENNTMQPNFTRDIFKTIAEMKAVAKKKMPQMLIASCIETGKVYVYNKNAENDSVLGLWREIGFAKSGQSEEGGTSSGGIDEEAVQTAIDEAIAKIIPHTMLQFDVLPEEDIDGIKFSVGMAAYQKSDKSIYEVEQYYDGQVAWRLVANGNNSGSGEGGGSGDSGDNPPVATDTLYYGYINGTLETTETVSDEGFEINESVLKSLSTKAISGKANTITYTATAAEDNALGQSFPTYAYPAKFGELTTYKNNVGTFNVSDAYTKFDITVDGMPYYAYVQTNGHAPRAGDTFDFTYA